MFAGAVRETVYSRPDVIKRVTEEFVPVALKAALINSPPGGLEGTYLAEVGRTKAAPQGIVAANASGKILVWALSFSSSDEIPKFLDYVHERNLLYPDDSVPVPTKRFMRFPNEPMADVEDSGAKFPAVEQHAGGDDFCPGVPPKVRGTFVARVLGRRLENDGSLCGECTKQENYIEDVFDVAPSLQRAVARAVAGGDRARLPDAFARALATYCYLGMLDVRPVAPPVPDHRSSTHALVLHAEPAEAVAEGTRRYRITGRSDVESNNPGRGDGANYSHRVTLIWEGYLTLRGQQIVDLTLLANGREKLRWGNDRAIRMVAGIDPATHLMGGRPFNIDSPVRYGVHGAPVAEKDTWQGDGPAPASGPGGVGGPPPGMREKMQRLQRLMPRISAKRRRAVMPILHRFEAHIRANRVAEAVKALDEALALGEGGASGDLPADLRAKLRQVEAALRRLVRAGRKAEAQRILDSVLAAIAGR